MTGKRNSTEQTANKQSKTLLKWTEAMKTKLLECKREAMDFVQSKDPPRKADGKKQGYMAIMKQLWDNSEFADLNISTQISEIKQLELKNRLEVRAQRFVRNRRQQMIYCNLTWTIKKRVAKIWNSIIMNSTTTQFHQEILICILRTRKSQRKMKRLLK